MDDRDALRCATDCTPDEVIMDKAQRRDPTVDSSPCEVEQMERPESECALTNEDDVTAADLAAREAEVDETRVQQQTIEALLFATDTPVSAAKLAGLVDGCTPGLVRKHIEALNQKYEEVGLSFRIEPIARGYQMMTIPEFHDAIGKLHKQRAETRLSPAALETVAIIAYKQPIIRADVEAIRGVACGEVISRLREMGLVRILGRADVIGRPLLYGTTKRFLDTFGLADLDDLPPMEALRIKPKPEPETAEESASEPVSKDADEVEPVKPPVVVEEEGRSQMAIAGA